MKGIIIKKGILNTIVLTKEGDFRKIRKQRDHQIGDQVNDNINKGIYFQKFAMMAATVLIVLGLAGYAAANHMTAYRVNMDVNPSLTFRVNTLNRVLEVIPNTEETKEIEGWENLKGLKLNEAIKESITRLESLDFLLEDGAIVISVEGNDGRVKQITNFINSEYQLMENHLTTDTEGQVITPTPHFEIVIGKVTSEMFEKSKEHQIPVGRVLLIERAIDSGADINFDDAKDLSVQDIQRIYKIQSDIVRIDQWTNEEEQNQGIETAIQNINRNIIRNTMRLNDEINETAKKIQAGEQVSDSEMNRYMALSRVQNQLKDRTVADITGTPSARPVETGKPDDVGRPDSPGNSDQTGKPDDVGRPDSPGNSDQTGKPDDVERPENPGNSEHTGKPENPGNSNDRGRPNNPRD